jgi:hypothetical protein
MSGCYKRWKRKAYSQEVGNEEQFFSLIPRLEKLQLCSDI